MNPKFLQISALLFCLLAFPIFAKSEVAQRVIYVNVNNGNDFNSGESWNSAFKSLQQALDVATNGDTVKVAAGTYLPTKKIAEVYSTQANPPIPTNDRHRSFLLKSIVYLYGGFPSDATPATTMKDRDWEKYPTILSGDFNGDDGDNHENMDENALHVMVMLNVNTESTLDGFYISGGNAANDSASVFVGGTIVSYDCGGGIYAIAANQSVPTLTNVVISGNRADMDGGGFYNYSLSNYASPKLKNVTLINNYSGERGGAFCTEGQYADPILVHVSMVGNTSAAYGGGFFCMAGKATAPYFENVLISGNKAAVGGGAYIVAIEEDASPIITNATICGNRATNNGRTVGGILITAQMAKASPSLRNSVIWGNKDNNDIAYPGMDLTYITDNILFEGKSGTNPEYSHCLIEGLNLVAGENLSGYENPMFTSPVDADFAPTVTDFGDYRLLPASPLINKGNNAYVSVPEDLDGQSRIFGGTVDIGAYELQSDPSPNEVVRDNEWIWGHQGNLHVQIANKTAILRIYSTNGTLVKQVNDLAEGFYTFALPDGLYIVTLSTGKTAKIFIR